MGVVKGFHTTMGMSAVCKAYILDSVCEGLAVESSVIWMG